MSLIKALPAPKFTKYEEAFEELSSNKDYKQIEVRIGKAGWYFNRINRKSWIEFIHNQSIVAFEEKSPKQFLYELELANFIPLTKREIGLIKSLLLFQENKEFKNKLYRQSEFDILRNISREKYKRIIEQRNCIHEFNESNLWCDKCLLIKSRAN